MAKSRWNRRRGFTLIELLVVIAIIGILMALLLPAVQKVRESANRLKCQNNLKQIGLALHHYNNTNRCFPLGWYTVGSGSTLVENSWIARILPYIEQDNLYRQIDLTLDWKAGNSGVNATRINLLRCPSAPNKRGDESVHAMTDYSATNLHKQSGVDLSPWYADWHTYDNGGVLKKGPVAGDTKGNRVYDIADGTSNTIMVGECAGRDQHWINGELDSTTGTGGTWAGAWAQPNGELAVEGYDLTTQIRGKKPQPPCAVNCMNGGEIYAFHSGGANVVMADGSVHFLKATTDITLLRALITIDGKEVTNPDS